MSRSNVRRAQLRHSQPGHLGHISQRHPDQRFASDLQHLALGLLVPLRGILSSGF
ncbi:MAG: hypothetical protein HC910_12210 [Spirulinaceae cyanobacterium SM2_1_0]|nr:hypothetical protein [Spirulinaceae cyanobacterium SM2_1_0]